MSLYLWSNSIKVLLRSKFVLFGGSNSLPVISIISLNYSSVGSNNIVKSKKVIKFRFNIKKIFFSIYT